MLVSLVTVGKVMETQLGSDDEISKSHAYILGLEGLYRMVGSK